ncbi:MAG: GNAT family N-acetyltransferase [Steroidobacteraceae bacterium]
MDVRVDIVDWLDYREQLLAIRFEVFVHEQGVPVEEEHDAQDHLCIHALACVNGEPVGTGRLLPTGKIGRMAVLALHRRHGIGALLLHKLMQHARLLGFDTVYLDAQLGALAFYERHGFVATGPVFKDAGIDHRRMTRPLDAPLDEHGPAILPS